MAWTRTGRRPPAARRAYASSVPGSTPASCTLVRPRVASSRKAVRIESSSSRGPGRGIASSSGSMAASSSTPPGRPAASRWILPPGGSGVTGPMPARTSARRFTHAACPSTRISTTGWSGTARSRMSAVGKAPPQRFWSQPRPFTHDPGGSDRARSAAREAQVPGSRTPAQRTSARARASPSTCPCASASPGMALPRPRAMTRGALPEACSHAASDPTRKKRPSRRRTASARGSAGSRVWMVPVTRRSGISELGFGRGRGRGRGLNEPHDCPFGPGPGLGSGTGPRPG